VRRWAGFLIDFYAQYQSHVMIFCETLEAGRVNGSLQMVYLMLKMIHWYYWKHALSPKRQDLLYQTTSQAK